MIRVMASCAVLMGGCLSLALAQQSIQPPGGGPAKSYWVEKTRGGVYIPPNKPITRLADLKAAHAGQTNWSELIMRDAEQQAVYNSAAPGTKFARSLHPDTGEIMVIVAGEMHVDIQAQAPIVATRGSIVNIVKTTPYSFEIAGDQPALWVTVDPLNFKTLYPASDPKPKLTAGGDIVKVAFANGPASYVEPNMPHWNLFEAAKLGSPRGVRVIQDHLFATPLYGFADPDDPLNPNRGKPDALAPPPGAAPASKGPFDPHSSFGHLHAGPAEWWIVQVGQIDAKFENVGELVAREGDVLYAAPMTWHQMAFKGPGPSCRLAMGAYELINMNNTNGQ